MGKIQDLTGQKFERWTVLEFAGIDKHHNALWLCECNCENKTRKIVVSNNLKRGISKSCGCLMREMSQEKIIKFNKENPKSAFKHGLSNTRIYTIWSCMIDRCYRKKNKKYLDYGGRGIKVCDEWRHDVATFWEWAKNNGYAEDLEIERIDNNGNYEPSNCRWATRREQVDNRRNTRMLTYNGKTQSVSQWAEEIGISYITLLSRIDKLHWDVEKALTTKPRKTYNHKEKTAI